MYEVTVRASDQTNGQETYLALTALWLSGTLMILLFRALRRRTFLRSLHCEEVQSGREWLALDSVRELLRIRTSVGLIISPAKNRTGSLARLAARHRPSGIDGDSTRR